MQLYKKITLRDIATHIGMNKSACCTFIKRHTGTTLVAYLTNLRLAKAVETIRRLIATDEHITISAIAYQSGFHTIPYFNTCFKRRYGCSPSEYISQLRQKRDIPSA